MDGSIGVEFDAWRYLASNKDLISVYSANKKASINHAISESPCLDTFDDRQYLISNVHLRNVFGNVQELVTKHYVKYGFKVGRSVDTFGE